MPTRRRSGAGRDRTSQLMLEIRGPLRQIDAAERAGLTQTTVSRAEQGTRTLTPDEAAQYASRLGATAAQTRELVRLCQNVESQTIAGQARVVRRGAEIQRRIRELEQQSVLLRSWQPTMISGLLQTWDYTLALIEMDVDEKWADERRARVALLDDPGRRFRIVMSEAALRWVVGSTGVMLAQIEHLHTLSGRPNIELGIVPFGQTAVPPPEGAFHLYGDRVAQVATDAGTVFLSERADLDMFAAWFDRLASVAVVDEQARALLAETADLYRPG